MKLLSAFLVGFLYLLNSASASGNYQCVEESLLAARMFSAQRDGIPLRNVKVMDWFVAEETGSLIYFGVRLNTNEKVNVGMVKRNCRLAHEPNFVTDGAYEISTHSKKAFINSSFKNSESIEMQAANAFKGGVIDLSGHRQYEDDQRLGKIYFEDFCDIHPNWPLCQ